MFLIKLIAAILMIISSFYSFSSESLDLSQSQRPSPTLQNLRWLMPADSWPHRRVHLASGKYFKILASSSESIGLNSVSIYSSIDLTGKPSITVSGNRYFINGLECSFNQAEGTPTKLEKNLTECGYNFCDPYRGDAPVRLSVEKDLSIDPTVRTTLNKCPMILDYVFTTRYSTDNHQRIYEFLDGGYQGYYSSYLFNFSGSPQGKNYLETVIENKKYYVDIRICKGKPTMCEVIDIKDVRLRSRLERVKTTSVKKRYRSSEYSHLRT